LLSHFVVVHLTKLKYGEKAVVTAIRLGFNARKKLLTYGISLGTIVKMEYSPSFSSLVNINIQGKSFCIRKLDAKNIEVIKYSIV
jgi:Fe2+ transport system protein FeoA